MADNTHYYGFRWVRSKTGGVDYPSPLKMSVASGQDDQDDNSNSVDLNVGDPVKLVASGGVTLAQNGDRVFGIIVAVAPYWDGTKLTPSNKLPNQTTWGSVEERRSFVYVVPASAGYWEIDVDDSTTATTKAAYIALQGLNVDHTVPGDTANTSADPYIDISNAATTAALTWRIVEVSQSQDNRDFSGANVKLIVAVNESEEGGAAATTDTGT